MRILHIDTGREMRGGQFQVLFLLQRLAELGHQCRLLAPPGSPLAVRVARAGVPVASCSLLSVFRNRTAGDVVHTHTGRAHTFAALAGAGHLVVSRRVAFPVRSGWASHWKYTRARHYIAVSKHVKRTLIDADVASERISVVYDGVPPIASSVGGSRVIAIETADPRKGSRIVKEAAARAGIDVDFVTDLQAGLKDAAVLVYITDLEGLGSGALLAMAAGVPVVASRRGGLTEVVTDGETGYLVDHSPEEIAARIRELTGNAELRKRMGARARQRVAERFTIEHMVEGTLAVYKKVAG